MQFTIVHELGKQVDYLHHWATVSMMALDNGNAQSFNLCPLSVSTHPNTTVHPLHKSEMEEWVTSAQINVSLDEHTLVVDMKWNLPRYPWVRTMSVREAQLIALNGLYVIASTALQTHQAFAGQVSGYGHLLAKREIPTLEWKAFQSQVRRAHWDVLGESPMWML